MATKRDGFARRHKNKTSLVAVLAVLAWVSQPAVSQDFEAVSIDSVSGLVGIDSIASGQLITFYFRMSHFAQDSFAWVIGLRNGFRVYSPDSAAWNQTVGSFTAGFPDTFLDKKQINYASQDGSDADTVMFSANNSFVRCGLPPGFEAIVFALSIGPISPTHSGKTICIDSCSFTPFAPTQWILGICDVQSSVVLPMWPGPYEYTIVDTTRVAVIDSDVARNSSIALGAPFPNPFNSSVTLVITDATSQVVTLDVYNALGALVATAYRGHLSPGRHEIPWSPGSHGLGSGLYFVRLQAHEVVDVREVVYLK